MPPLLRRIALTAMALSAAGHGAQAASAASVLLYERALMDAAGARCALFTPAVAGALKAARAQARATALRAGDGAGAVRATEARALTRAGAVDCRAPGLRVAADRVREAFADYAKLSVMRFPGARSAWRAERADPRLTGPRWRLVQALPGTGGWVLFGLQSGRPTLLDARRGAMPAAGARLSVRDPARLDAPFLLGPPPPADSRMFLAQGRATAVRALLPAGADRGVLFTFAPEALQALAGLDARETAEVALVYPAAGRERVYAAPIEVGDVALALAFLAAAGSRPPS